MKAINYYLSFGIKPTLKKILSVLVSKYAPKKLFLENKDKGINDIPEINTINTENKSQDYTDYLKIQIKTSVSRTRYVNPLKRFIQSRSKLIEHLTKTAKNHNLKCCEMFDKNFLYHLLQNLNIVNPFFQIMDSR